MADELKPMVGWSDEELTHVVNWLNAKWGEKRSCPLCDADNWFVGKSPAHIVIGDNTGNTHLGSSYPCFVVICTNCGNTVLVNIHIAGLAFQKEERKNG